VIQEKELKLFLLGKTSHPTQKCTTCFFSLCSIGDSTSNQRFGVEGPLPIGYTSPLSMQAKYYKTKKHLYG